MNEIDDLLSQMFTMLFYSVYNVMA